MELSTNKCRIEEFDEFLVAINVEKEVKEKSYSILEFGYPHNKIILSANETVKLYDSETFEFIRDLVKFDRSVYRVVRWDETTCICCCCSRDTVRMSIKEPYEVKNILKSSSEQYNILKLNDTYYAVYFYPTQIGIVNYKTGQMEKEYYIGRMSYSDDSRMLLSRKHENSFYVVTQDKNQAIKMVDFKKDMITKEFFSGSSSKEIYSVSIYENSKKEEMLISMCSMEFIWIYNTNDQKFSRKIQISQIEEEEEYIEYENLSTRIESSVVLKNMILVVGAVAKGEGNISIYNLQDFEKNGKLKRIHSKDFPEAKGFSDLQIMSDDLENKHGIRMIASSHNKNVIRFKITGLKLENEVEIMDVKERVLFLRENVDDYVFSDQEKKSVFLDVKFIDGGVIKCLCRSLFY